MFAKATLIAAAMTAALAVMPETASASTSVKVGVGSGWVGGCYGWSRWGQCGWGGHRHFHRWTPGWNYRYRPGVIRYYGHPAPQAARLDCGEAKALLRHRGYAKVRTTDCTGQYFSFRAVKGGHGYIVKVNAWSGRIVSAKRA